MASSEENKQRIDCMRSTFSYINDYIKLSDTKAAAITAGCVFLCGMVGPKIPITYTVLPDQFFGKCGFACAAILWSVAIFTAMISSVWSIYPRLHNPQRSYAGFPSISMESPEYSRWSEAATTEDIITHLAKQNINLSSIAMRKFSILKIAIVGLMSSIVSSAIIYTVATLNGK